MGVTALVRWPNAPTTSLDLIRQNVLRNHGGIERGRWMLSVKSYRSNIGLPVPSMDRALYALTMNNLSFVLLEDPAAPQVAEMAALSQPNGAQTDEVLQGLQDVKEPPHYRYTLTTVTPLNALEQLIAQWSNRWSPTRQQSSNSRNQSNTSGNLLTVDGSVFSIGSDWLVRIGNVILAGGAVKGMLLEAEYLPLPKLNDPTRNDMPDLLSNLLISILPNTPSAAPGHPSAPGGVFIDDMLWKEVLWNTDDKEDREARKTKRSSEHDDIFSYEDEEDSSIKQPGDWVGTDRDRRSSFLIISSLRSEGLL